MRTITRILVGLALLSTPGWADVLAVLQINYTTSISGIGTVGVGPVGARLNNGPGIQVVCDDFSGETLVPSNFQVTVNSLADLGTAKFQSQSNAVLKYEGAAWLMTKMSQYTLASDVTAIQFAIWGLFAGSAPSTSASAVWYNAALALDPTAYSFENVRILTPRDTTNQEFLSGTVTPIPEQATLLNVGLGLILVGSLARVLAGSKGDEFRAN